MQTLQRLRILAAVSEAGSFSRAAAALGMSQPAVSQQITVLERELGTTLCRRSVRGVQLTHAGQIVHRHALAILGSVHEAKRELAIMNGESQRIRVAAFPSACVALLPKAVRLFQELHPGVDLTFDEVDAQPALDLVKAGTADLAIVFDYAARPLVDPAVRFHHLLDDTLFVGLPADHPKGSAPIVDLAELADLDWISGTAFSCGEVLQAICGAAGFTPKIAFESNRYPTTLAMIAAGHGIALIPSLAFNAAQSGVNIRLLRPAPPSRRVWVVNAHQDHPPAIVSEMLDCLTAASNARLPATTPA